MEASVLGLKIARIKEGYQDLLEINGDASWTKKVWDIRRDLPTGTNTEEGKTVLLLSGVESGTILTIAACIEGRQNDCISAWLYVPSIAEVTGKQLVEIIDETKKELVANERNDIKLRQLFEKNYPVCDATRTSIVSSGEQYAFRKYGRGSGYELYELLNNPDQADYRPFKGVFLIDSTSGITCEGTDLTTRPLRAFVKIKPVTYIHGFKAFIGDTPIDKSIFLPEGDDVVITWKRSGYKSIEKKWVVREGQPVPGISEPDYKVLVPYDRFIVKDQNTGESIKHYTVKVNNTVILEGYQLPVSEAVVGTCPVTVEANGYSAKSKVCNLNSERIYFALEKEKLSYDFKIELQHDDNRYADLHVETNVKLNGKSPIAGYVRDRRNGDYLNYHPYGNKQKLFAMIVLLATLLLGVVGGILLSNAINKKSKGPEISTTYGTVGEPSNPNTKTDDSMNASVEIKSVISYLDSHEKWNRTEMENFKVIQGLWDALNERRFDDILNHEHEKELEGSYKFRELVEAIKDNKHKSFAQNFNKEASDYDITIGSKDTPRSYIKKLYDANEPGQSSGSSKPATRESGNSSADKQNSIKQDEF